MKLTIDTCNNMDKSLNIYTEGKKPDTKMWLYIA